MDIVWILYKGIPLFTRVVAINPLTAERALRALIDSTLSNARRLYSSMGNPLAGKGLRLPKRLGQVYPLNMDVLCCRGIGKSHYCILLIAIPPCTCE